MPQMAPMNWTLLFAIFILLYLITMTIIYFMPTPSRASLRNSMDQFKSDATWKW